MKRTRRSPARWLAPLALIAVVVAFAAIVTRSNDNGTGSSASEVGTTQSTTTRSGTTSKAGTTVAKTKAAGSKVYVVKVGDTLGSIAGKTGVSLARLEELNPNVDSNLMTAGQKIRIR